MEPPNNVQHEVHAIISGRSILLWLPKDMADIAFIRSLGHARWDAMGFCWVVQNHPANIRKLNDYFAARLKWRESSCNEEKKPAVEVKPEPQSLRVIRFRHGRIRLVNPYEPEFARLIKQLPLCMWEQETKSWTLPHSEKILEQLKHFCTNHGWKFRYEEESSEMNRKPNPRPSAAGNPKKCPETYLEKLIVLRYSPRTIEGYVSCFTEFINYFREREPARIEHAEIMTFLRYLIEVRCISTSYQNQMISAIKFWFEKVLGLKRETYYLERPRREGFLPTVLHEDEISAILGTIRNLKHKCLIMTAYSAGLRVSELLNLRIRDIDSKRMLIRVNQGKGRKDRVTLLSVKLLEILRVYYKQYHPKEFLFEGASGGRYAERSVQNVLQRACRDAGILKHTTMHTLRHTFATHLLEHNTDIRYIQELLGHTNPKTTQIYTHITTKGLDQLKSPLDNIDL